MPDAGHEIVYTALAKPPSWGERLIRAHTPEAHYQDLMKKYFWVTDRLEGKSLELAQRLRPTVELAARAAGWTRTITEAYLAGSAVTVTAILAGKGLKSAADVFSDLARKHGSTMSTPACIEAPKKTPSPELAPSGPRVALAVPDLGPKPSHLSRERWKAMERISRTVATDVGAPGEKRPRVAPVVRDNGQVLSAMLAAMKEAIQHRIVMQTAGQEARAFGGWVQKNLPDLPIEERRHAQRAYAHILQALLSDNGTGPHQTDFAQAFLKALEKTKPKSGGLTSEYIKPVLTALRKFNNLASHGTSRLREVK